MIDTRDIRDRILLLALKGELVEQNPKDTPAIDLIDEVCRKMAGRAFKPDFSVDEVPYDLPSSWSWCRLSDIGSTNIGLTYHPEDVIENGVIVARSSNIVNGKMDYSDLVRVSCNIRENQYLNNSDILICARNGSKALVGKCAIYEGDSKTIAFGAFMAVFRTPLFRYVYYYLNTDVFKRNFISDDSKQINQVTQNILKKSLIPIPPLEEQKRIVESIEAIFKILDKIDALQNRYASNQEALKNKLIDAAIQGKLTEQLPEDGTAEELFEQIQNETQILSKEGRFKKKKALPDLTDADYPFEIPETWKWVHLGDVLSIESGKGLTAAEMIPGDIPVYGGNGITGYHDNGFVPAGTVVIGRVGYYCGSVHVTKSESWVTDNAFITTYPEHCIDKRFLVYVLRKMKLGQNNNGSAQPVVSGKKIYPLAFPLPPLAEQKRIADIFKTVIPMCENTK